LWLEYLIKYQGNVDKVRLCAMTPELSAAQVGEVVSESLPSRWNGGAVKPWYYLKIDDSRDFQGSYALNGFLYTDLNYSITASQHPNANFQKESNVLRPTLTPLFGDAVWIDAWPDKTDPKPSNLYLPNWTTTGNGSGTGMMRFCVGRHGKLCGAQAPKNLPPTTALSSLPGAINVVFVDGHVDLVRLPNLWQLHWSKDWESGTP
jgi:prepilin-type processing-associated H-X9-DG protein